MSGTGTSELLLLFVVGLLVLGPERLPKVASRVGRWIALARREVNRMHRQIERETALQGPRAGQDEPSQVGGDSSKQAAAESASRGEAEAEAQRKPKPKPKA